MKQGMVPSNSLSLSEAFDQKGEEVVSLLKLLAHPVRLKVLCLLGEKEHSVGELVTELNMAQASVSQILAMLRADGLVTYARDGQKVIYSIGDKRILKLIKSLKDIFC